MRTRSVILGVLIVVCVAWFLGRMDRDKHLPETKLAHPVAALQQESAVPAPTTVAGPKELYEAEPIDKQGSYSDMSAQKEEWFSHLRKEFGPGAREVKGKVTIAYRGYEGKFNVHFLLPPESYEGSSAFSIFVADEKNPAVNSLGGGGLVDADGEGNPSMVRFVGNAVQPFFSKKPDSEEKLAPRNEPSNISLVLFPIDLKKKYGTSVAKVQFGYETESPATDIGTFEYIVKPTTSASL